MLNGRSNMPDGLCGSDSAHGSANADQSRRANLERILREALLKSNDVDLLAAEQRAMESLVARHGAQELTLEPIAIDLVAALLGAAFRVRIEQSPLCMEMSKTIARSLWGDPIVRDRMDGLWRRLTEQAR